MRGITNSLNVAMTANIVLYELLGRWQESEVTLQNIREAL